MRARPFILATMALDAAGIGIVFPVMPDLIGDVMGGGAAAWGNAALWGGVLGTAYALMQLLCAPVLGALSDRLGRRPVLLGSLAVMALDYALSALAGSIWLLLALRLVAGATGATHATCNAAIADLTPPEDRARAFGQLNAAFLAGFVLGPVLGGLLGEIGPRAPFWVAGALALANLALGALTLPETVTAANHRPFAWARANPLGAFLSVGRLGGAARLLVVLLLHDTAIVAYSAVWAFWGRAAFGWSAWETGVSLAAFAIAGAVTQVWALPWYLRRLGERGTILFGLGFTAAALVAFAALPPTPWGGWAAILLCPVSALGEVARPAIQGRLSRLAPPSAQGETMGVAGAVQSAAAVIGPLVMTAAFAWGAGLAAPLYGAPYLLGAGLMAACVALTLRPGPT